MSNVYDLWCDLKPKFNSRTLLQVQIVRSQEFLIRHFYGVIREDPIFKPYLQTIRYFYGLPSKILRGSVLPFRTDATYIDLGFPSPSEWVMELSIQYTDPILYKLIDTLTEIPVLHRDSTTTDIYFIQTGSFHPIGKFSILNGRPCRSLEYTYLTVYPDMKDYRDTYTGANVQTSGSFSHFNRG